MILSINYADVRYKKHQKINSFSAKYFAKVDQVISYTQKDIDEDFRNKNKTLLSIQRGNGLWLWKPYFIQKSLDLIEHNDYLLYTDSGVQYVRNIAPLIIQLEKSKQDIMLFDLPLIEIQWTKKYTIKKINGDLNDFDFSNQRNGAFILIKKTPNSTAFIKEWLNLCCQPDLLQPTDKHSNNEDMLFIEHREDQSILSLLSKKWGIGSFSDPSDFSKLPYLYLSKNYLVRIPSYEENLIIKKVFFIHSRGNNIIEYLIKFLIRYFLMSLIDPIMKTRKEYSSPKVKL